jgi:hypothetical protein
MLILWILWFNWKKYTKSHNVEIRQMVQGKVFVMDDDQHVLQCCNINGNVKYILCSYQSEMSIAFMCICSLFRQNQQDPFDWKLNKIFWFPFFLWFSIPNYCIKILPFNAHLMLGCHWPNLNVEVHSGHILLSKPCEGIC